MCAGVCVCGGVADRHWGWRVGKRHFFYWMRYIALKQTVSATRLWNIQSFLMVLKSGLLSLELFKFVRFSFYLFKELVYLGLCSQAHFWSLTIKFFSVCSSENLCMQFHCFKLNWATCVQVSVQVFTGFTEFNSKGNLTVCLEKLNHQGNHLDSCFKGSVRNIHAVLILVTPVGETGVALPMSFFTYCW